MQPTGHARHAEEHDAKEHRLKEKCSHDLIGQQRPCDIADTFHEARPVRAELERHGDARHHPHRKTERKDLDPETIGFDPFFVFCRVEAQFEKQKRPAQRDGDGWE